MTRKKLMHVRKKASLLRPSTRGGGTSLEAFEAEGQRLTRAAIDYFGCEAFRQSIGSEVDGESFLAFGNVWRQGFNQLPPATEAERSAFYKKPPLLVEEPSLDLSKTNTTHIGRTNK